MSDSQQMTLIERYQRLIEISKGLASTLDLDVLLDRIVHAAADLSNASEASILLYDESQYELVFQAATNRPKVRGLSVPVGGSIAGWIITNQKPIIISDVNKDDRYYKNIEEASQVTIKSLLGVPLVTKNKVIGVLEAINKQNGGFTPEDQEILMTLGAQAAIAIENSRLFQQSDLIAEFVHEIRTPLSSIATAAQLLQYPELPEDKHQQMAKVIQNESVRLSEMAASFLNLARLESGRTRFDFQDVRLTELLVECGNLMEMNATQEGLEFALEIPEDLPVIKGDADKLKQAIINLLSNAIKYNRPGGQITLRTFQEDQNIAIEVEDTGIGISEDNQRRLFERFYRVPGTENISFGTGLGLTIVKRIVEGHKGTIKANSTQGNGTIFKLTFPIT
jgi:signal transduction histidine kinase